MNWKVMMEAIIDEFAFYGLFKITIILVVHRVCTFYLTGIYWKLQDASLSWSDKVKIARYTWKFDHVRLPNKEQVVLDWLCQSLTGKKRLGLL